MFRVFTILYLKGNRDGATYEHCGLAEVSSEIQTFGPTIVKEHGPDVMQSHMQNGGGRYFSRVRV